MPSWNCFGDSIIAPTVCAFILWNRWWWSCWPTWVARQHQQLLSLLLLPKIRGNTGSYYSSYIMLCIGRVVWLSLSLSLSDGLSALRDTYETTWTNNWCSITRNHVLQSSTGIENHCRIDQPSIFFCITLCTWAGNELAMLSGPPSCSTGRFKTNWYW